MVKLMVGKTEDPYYNLAREEILMGEEEEYLLLWRSGPSVILGKHQNTLREIDEKYCREHQIHVVRRMTGGGAVYHDLGNINYSYFFRCWREHPFEERMKGFQGLLMDVLQETGVRAEWNGRNDICVKQGSTLRKISGCAMLQRGERGLFHGTLLYDADLEQMRMALSPPRLKLESKGIASVRSRVANLREISGTAEKLRETSCGQYMGLLAEKLGNRMKAEPAADTALEQDIRRLSEGKYRTWDWNYGNNPACSIEREARFPAGVFQLGLELKGGTIIRCRLSGDYFETEAAEQIEAGMRDIPYREQAVSKRLDQLPWRICFQTEEKERLMNLFFGEKER